MTANERQVDGNHYGSQIQHWDYVVANDLDYFQGQITKYVTRWKKKNGLKDLEKAQHFLEKYLEIERVKYDKMIKEVTTQALAPKAIPKWKGMEHPFGYDAAKEI